jgi:hypothetical protein
MTRLDVPYRSQWDGDANKYPADCGPTCVAMGLNYRAIPITPNEVYNFIPSDKGPRGITSVAELMNVIGAHDFGSDYARYNDKTAALNGLRASIDRGYPVIALVKYAPWRQATAQTYEGGHFVVVTGYDDANITMHDPLLDQWSRKGSHFVMSHDLFCAGWGGFAADENPNWACFTVKTKKTAGGQPAPAPTPAPAPAPVMPPPPAAGSPTMDDVNRRIRGLAAYRRTEGPDFNDPSAVQFWQDHLGDWGLTYDRYKVQPGDTLSRISERFYSDFNRWYAIRAYNDLPQNGFIWAGQMLLIPHLGTTGAHTDPALPSDTEGFGKDIDLENLVDPDLPAEDYNDFADGFNGMGFEEPAA